MKTAAILTILAAAFFAGLLHQASPTQASFHLMRIHSVMSGHNADNTIQFVELRMCFGGQALLTGTSLKFYDGAGTLKGTFVFPGGVVNAFTGDSILIATAEYDANSQGPGGGGSGGDADFVFSLANTTAANGGDALHPVQGPDGKVVFADLASDGCDAGLTIQAGDVDSVAYGTAPADFGSAAPALPNPTDNRALRESDITHSSDNSVDYGLAAVSATAKTVSTLNLTTDLDTPRNNAREVAVIASATDADGDGVLDVFDLCPGTGVAQPVDANGCSDQQVDPDGDGICDPGAPSSGPSACTGSDNCPSAANNGQADADSDGFGDACDNCVSSANADQDDFDIDTIGDACDTGDSDLDGTTDAVEYHCGSVVGDIAAVPERVDGVFSGVSDDGDVAVDEALPAGAEAFDCDGDGFIGTAEAHIFSGIGGLDQDPCGLGEWAVDFDGGTPPNSLNKVNIRDLQTFILPVRRIGTSPGDGGFDIRWDLNPGPGVFGTDINVADLQAMVFSFPPMFGGATRSFNGPVCPWP